MAKALSGAALREWLVDYLITNVGCDHNDVDPDSSFWDLGVASRDAVVLSGELAELLGRPVSPVEFWQHPTINALTEYLTAPESKTHADTAVSADRRWVDEPIAVIGLGCRFPGGISGPEAYWQFLSDGQCSVGAVPPDRWLLFDDGSHDATATLAHTPRWGSFLSDIDAFDAKFFEISPREAAKMDPQQRLLLEVAWEALEHAGIPADSLRHSQTGVFVGACVSEYGYLASADLPNIDAWSNTGGALSIIANRLSYFLDLRGPSIAVDTACSSSLVAVHLACQSLRLQDSHTAIAAGVNLLLSPAVFQGFDQAHALSPTGRCHAFDARADGFVRGEGAGVVVLKRLGDALRDGDRVLAVVRGSAVNQDGRSNGLMAPNPAAQMAVLRAAYTNAGVSPREVDYVETHGTGTLLGDPIEARALGTVLGRGRAAQSPLLIGAAKSNLGHLEAAAGVAGFIKAVLALQRGHIPANLDFENPNPHIPFDQLRLKVVAEQQEWPSVNRPRRAGVSSFGFGGTNAHVVLEQGPDPVAVPGAGPVVSTLVVSGKSVQRVAVSAGVLAEWMDGDGAAVALADVAHTLNHHRARQVKFATVCARDRGQAVAGLRALAGGYPAPGVVGPHEGSCGSGTVFVYSGQGSQWAGMGQRLLADEPAFAAAVAELEPVFVEQVGFSLRRVLAGGESVVGIDRVQPVLVGVQLALTALWRSYGVQPDAVIGHSMGEVSAAVVAGALSPAQGLTVIAIRSRLMARLAGQGAMALLELDAAAVEGLIAGYPGVSVAVYASPRQTVVAGPPEQVDALIAVVDGRGRLARRIEVDVASHHRIIDPVLPELRSQLADLVPQPPAIPVISTTADQSVGGGTAFDAEYWVANLRNPVRFSQAVAVAGAEHATFVEVSPNPVLTYAIDDTLAHLHHHSIGTLQRDTHDTLTFHTNLNATHTTRPPQLPHPPEPHPQIPTTPWHHTRHWITPRIAVPGAGCAPRAGTLLGAQISVAAASTAHLWQARLVPEAKPYPGSHRIHGLEVVPVSVLLATLLTAAAECGFADLGDIRFEYPIVLDEPRLIQVVADGGTLTLSSSAAADDPARRWVRHASARLGTFPSEPPFPMGEAHAGCNGAGAELPSTDLLEGWGVEGQPFSWSVESLTQTESGLAADVCVAEAQTVALLDAATHLARLVDSSNPRLMVPASVEGVRLSAELGDPRGTVDVRRRDGDGLVVDLCMKSSDGTICLEVLALRYADVDSGSVRPSRRAGDSRLIAHAIEWRPWRDFGDRSAATASPCTLAVLGKGGTSGAALQDQLVEAGYVPADVSTARCVLYLAEREPAGSDLDEAARMSAEVSDLVRQLAQRNPREPATLWIVTHGVHEAASAAALPQGCLWGVAAVIAAEQPDLWGGLIDLPADDDAGAHISALSTVLSAPSKRILALRDGEFLTPETTPISGEPVREPLSCRPDAAYLLTGGMGALGLLTADWLVDRGARRLVLAGRTALPPRRAWDSDGVNAEVRRKIAAVRALEMRGVAVDVVALDVGSPEALQDMLIRRDREGAPPIRGVVHAAGLTESALLTDMADGVFERVMWPKVAGAMALHEAFPPGCLDFFFLTASAGTVFGVPGQGAYAAANAYLDCLARARHRQGCHTLSLDWAAWEGLGFASDAKIVIEELKAMGSRPLTPEEAFGAWEYADGFDIAQVVMVPMPSDDLPEAAGSNGRRAPKATRAWCEMTPEGLQQELETGLRTILARELRMDEAEVDTDRPFPELGLNSMVAMTVLRETKQLVGMDLSATMLWNYPTISSLAAYLADKLTPEEESVEESLDVTHDSASSVLDDLFDRVESVPARSESDIR